MSTSISPQIGTDNLQLSQARAISQSARRLALTDDDVGYGHRQHRQDVGRHQKHHVVPGGGAYQSPSTPSVQKGKSGLIRVQTSCLTDAVWLLHDTLLILVVLCHYQTVIIKQIIIGIELDSFSYLTPLCCIKLNVVLHWIEFLGIAFQLIIFL